MLVPKPPVELKDHCSVVHDNTLYTYSAKGFASIPLERNGNWTELHMGEPVSNAACIKAPVDGDPDHQALYVVGGSTPEDDPSGLQRYSFQDKKWRSIQSARTNMANRTHHRVVSLEASGSILVYGGHQDDSSVGSSDTFVIQTTAPYGVLAYTSQGAPPSVSPVLVPWNDRQAALIGGDTTPKGVHLFEPKGGWHKSRVTLADELSDHVECVLMRGADGSKVLEVFDLSIAPNTVTSLALALPGGRPARPAKKVGEPAKKDRRDESFQFPPYDDELASSTEWQQYSMAQGDHGLVVFSGGGGSESLAIFNQTANGWLNATRLFYGDQSEQQILHTTTSDSPSATQSNDSSESGAASGDSASEDGGGSDVGTIVGATLGSILGVAAILLIILFLLKRKKDSRKRAAQAHGDTGDKNRLSFQDQGVEPLTRSAYPMAHGPAPVGASSVDSLAIFSGNVGDEKSPRPAGGRPSLQQNRQPPMKSSPLAAMATAPPAQEKSRGPARGGQPGDRRTDEGWARYFQDNDTASLVDTQPTQAPKPMNPASADNRQSTWPTASLTPLNFGFLEGPKPLGRVPSGSPTTEHPSGNHIAIPESQSARISSADSISLASDDYDQNRDSHWPQQRSWLGRPASSTYTASVYNPSSSNLPSAAPSVSDYRRHDSVRASTNTRGSSVVIPDTLEPLPTRNQNTDMSWLNLHAER